MKIGFSQKLKRYAALALVMVLCLAMAPVSSVAVGENTCPICNEPLAKDEYYNEVQGELNCVIVAHEPEEDCAICGVEVGATCEGHEHGYGCYDWDCEHVVETDEIDEDNTQQQSILGALGASTQPAAGPSPSNPGGGNTPNESYYDSSHYLLWAFDYSTSNQPSKNDVTVTTNSKTITYDTNNNLSTSATTTGDAITGGVIKVSVPVGYRLASYRIVCGDKSGCQTAANNNETKGSFDTTGDYTSTVSINVAKVDFGHTSKESPYVLLLTFVKVTETYRVEYNLGAIADVNFSSANVPSTDTGLAYNSTYSVKDITTTASEAAALVDYEFAGWKAETTANYNGSTFQYNSSFAVQANTLLVAQWAPKKYTLTYLWDGDAPDEINTPANSTELVNNDTVNLATVESVNDGKTFSYDDDGNLVYTDSSNAKWTFLGWYASNSASDTTTINSVTINKASVTVYGRWQKGNPVTYSYEVNVIYNDQAQTTPSEGNGYTTPASGQTYENFITTATTEAMGGPLPSEIIDEVDGVVYGTWKLSILWNHYLNGNTTSGGSVSIGSKFDIPTDPKTTSVKFVCEYTYTPANRFSLSYNLNLPVGANSITAPGTVIGLLKNQVVTLDTTTVKPDDIVYGYENNKYGYWTFEGWKTYNYGDSIGNTVTNNQVTMPAADVAVYGSWSSFTEITTGIKFSKTFNGIKDSDLILNDYKIVITNNKTGGTPIAELKKEDAAVTKDTVTGDVVLTWTIAAFPTQVLYTATESDYEIGGYTWNSDSSTFDENGVFDSPSLVTAGEMTTIWFYNDYTPKYQVLYTWESYVSSYSYDASTLPSYTDSNKYAPSNSVTFKGKISPVIKIPATRSSDSREGYLVFDEWTVTGINMANLDASYGFTMPNNDVTFTGKLKFVPLYTVSYELDLPDGVIVRTDGGDFNLEYDNNDAYYEAGDQTVPFKNAQTFTDIPGTLDGEPGAFTFIGWEEDTTDLNLVTVDNPFTMPERDVTFVGTWEFTPTTYTVTYWFVGTFGTDFPNVLHIPDGDSNLEWQDLYTVKNYVGDPNSDPDAAGLWVFDGWFTKYEEAEGVFIFSGTEYQPGSEFAIEGNYSLYGKWTFKPYYTVTYNWTEADDSGNRPSNTLLTEKGIELPEVKKYTEEDTVLVESIDPWYFEVTDSNGLVGYWVFKGWTTEDVDGFANNTEKFKMPNTNVLLKGDWEFSQIVISGITKVYDATEYGTKVEKDDYSENGPYEYRYSADGVTNWSVWSSAEPRRTDVDKIYVQVRVKVGESNEDNAYRFSNTAIVEITKRPITFTAGDGGPYRYNGSLRTVDTYIYTVPTTAQPDRGLVSGERQYSSAYGSGRSVGRYTVYMGRNSSGNYPYSSVDANGTTVYVEIYKADGITLSTQNYDVTLVNGLLTIYSSTSTNTTTPTPTPTTTTTYTPTVTYDPPAYQSIPDSEVPLAAAPPADEVVIGDEDVPLGPATGDTAPILLLFAALILSGGAIFVISKKRLGKSAK